MDEIIFLVEEFPEGGYVARGFGRWIVVERDTWTELKEAVRKVVRNHFRADQRPSSIRLHVVREEVITT
jgi:hypothetical protein